MSLGGVAADNVEALRCARPIKPHAVSKTTKKRETSTLRLSAGNRESGSQIHTHDLLFCMSLLTTKVESRARPVIVVAVA